MQSVHSIESPSVTSCQTVVGVLVSGLAQENCDIKSFYSRKVLEWIANNLSSCFVFWKVMSS